MPADKNGEGIADLTQYLMCYQVRITHGTPLAQAPSVIYTHDQFGPDTYPAFGARELCVPSQVTLPLRTISRRFGTLAYGGVGRQVSLSLSTSGLPA